MQDFTPLQGQCLFIQQWLAFALCEMANFSATKIRSFEAISDQDLATELLLMI